MQLYTLITNMYVYVRGRPGALVDPLGLDVFDGPGFQMMQDCYNKIASDPLTFIKGMFTPSRTFDPANNAGDALVTGLVVAPVVVPPLLWAASEAAACAEIQNRSSL